MTNFEAEVLRSPVPVAVDFYSEQCGPCRILKPILESLAEAIGDEAKIVAVDVAENERLVIDHGINAVPTILVFKDGHEVRRMVGLAELGELRVALGV
jgi:thioredoxin 1